MRTRCVLYLAINRPRHGRQDLRSPCDGLNPYTDWAWAYTVNRRSLVNYPLATTVIWLALQQLLELSLIKLTTEAVMLNPYNVANCISSQLCVTFHPGIATCKKRSDVPYFFYVPNPLSFSKHSNFFRVVLLFKGCILWVAKIWRGWKG